MNRSFKWPALMNLLSIIIILFCIYIIAPFPNVTTHIIKAKFIRFFHSDRMCSTFLTMSVMLIIVYIPCNFINFVTSTVLVSFTSFTTTGSILPLSL